MIAERLLANAIALILEDCRKTVYAEVGADNFGMPPTGFGRA